MKYENIICISSSPGTMYGRDMLIYACAFVVSWLGLDFICGGVAHLRTTQGS